MVMITLGPARSRLLERIVAPVTEPLTLAETKIYLRVDGSAEDNLISDLIVSARIMAEQWLRRSLISQTWKLAYDYGIPESVWLPMGPVVDVVSVILFNENGDTTTLAGEQYWLSASRDMLKLETGACARRVEIVYHTGYGNAEAIPAPIKLGILAHVAQLFDNRGEGVAEPFPKQSAGLYLPFREVRL